jgi:hypothetical protein
MPQKPQARAKDKKRLTKRLANWRAKQELATKAPAPAAADAPKTAGKAPAKAAPAKTPAAKG